MKFKISKGFVFTIDSMFSLSALALLALVYMLLSYSHFEMQKYSSMENIGRDYLRLNYHDGIQTDNTFVYAKSNRTISALTYPQTYSLAENMGPFISRSGSWTNLAYDPGVGQVYTTLGYLRQQGTVAPGFQETRQAIAPALSGVDYYVEAKIHFHGPAVDNYYPIGGIGGRSDLSGGRYVCLVRPGGGFSKLAFMELTDWNSDLDVGAGLQLTDKLYAFAFDTDYTLFLNFTGTTIQCGVLGTNAVITQIDQRKHERGFPTLEYSSSSGLNEWTQFKDFKIIPTALNGSLVLRSSLHEYPVPCGCVNTTCVIANNSRCLYEPEDLKYSMKEVLIK